ncbi:MAG: biopolymer transporter ExbD, partial [Bacteroidetes bacterium]|nr:biopolymer transporter ExbD [Bacteroidota bacterium]
MARRGTPVINAGSMADIAFLLLIFFLVTTTMDTDLGLIRNLPPLPPPDFVPPDYKKRNIFVVLVNANNQLLVEGEPMHISQLKDAAKEFIANPNRREDLPEFREKEIPLLGKRMVSKQVISLQNDRGTSYETYIAVQNELATAYNELRDDLAMREFGEKYSVLIKKKKIGNNTEKIKATPLDNSLKYAKIL